MSEALSGLPVEVTVRDEHWIRQQNMGAFLSVTRGSAEPPRLLELSYTGAAADSAPLAIVGQTPEMGHAGHVIVGRTLCGWVRRQTSGVSLQRFIIDHSGYTGSTVATPDNVCLILTPPGLCLCQARE